MAQQSPLDPPRGGTLRMVHPRDRYLALLASSALGKFLYGFFFVVLLPLLLGTWARATRTFVKAPAMHSPAGGAALLILGVALIFAGGIALWRDGGGLPMNIAPPPRCVSSGVFALLPHPIYTGFCLACCGVALATGSASGFWLVTPCVILGSVALVLGYERPELEKRFGPARTSQIRILPPDSSDPPAIPDRLRCYFFLLIPWVALYYVSLALGHRSSISTYISFDRRIPVLPWTEFIYASAYPFVALVPLLARTQKTLRLFLLRGMIAMAIVFPLFWLLPFIAAPRPFHPGSIAGLLLTWERLIDSPAASFPSYHVIWSVLALPAYQDRWPKYRLLWRAWTVAIWLSCLTAGMHSLIDVLAGLVVALACLRFETLWQALRQGSDAVANSWREWRIGPLRIINHGFYAGAAGFIVLFIAGICAGPAFGPLLFAIAFIALLSSALWAQLLESSSHLLRPFGYFGGFFGVGLGAFLLMFFGAPFWLLVAALSVGAPWMQALGRLRCLVQGCCHGRPARPEIGICYRHERSRVAQLSTLRGVPLHPTQLYSILWNIYLGILMARLWLVHEHAHFLVGLYCILMGLGRFVEEAYRGEPQTAIIGGLRVYQWIAMATVLGGALITAVAKGDPTPAPHLAISAFLPAFAFGLLSTFALGVDFPSLNRRFSRLT